MESFAKTVMEQVLARPGAQMVFRARQLGLQLNDLIVLQVLNEYVPETEEPSLMLSIRELASIAALAGITKSQVETAIKRLVDAGLLIREQRDKRNREIAVTTLLPLAFHVVERGSDNACALPPMLRGLLAGEHGELIAAVQAAWENSQMPDAGVGSLYRGGGEGWSRIEQILRRRVDDAVGAIEAAVHAQEAREAQKEAGIYEVPVCGGGTVAIDAHAIERGAPAPCDVEIAVEVLTIAEQTRPGTITRKNIHARLAEALYSRHIGFARNLDAAKAIRVIGKQMTKDTWSRPYSIRAAWYTCCAAAIVDLPAASNPQVS